MSWLSMRTNFIRSSCSPCRPSSKDPQPEEDPSVNARIQRLARDYDRYGQRKTVEGVLLVHVSIHVLDARNAFIPAHRPDFILLSLLADSFLPSFRTMVIHTSSSSRSQMPSSSCPYIVLLAISTQHTSPPAFIVDLYLSFDPALATTSSQTKTKSQVSNFACTIG